MCIPEAAQRLPAGDFGEKLLAGASVSKNFCGPVLELFKREVKAVDSNFFFPLPVLEEKAAAAAEEEEAVKGLCDGFIFSQPSHKLGIWTNRIALSISLTAVLSLLLKQMCHNNHPIHTEGVCLCVC